MILLHWLAGPPRLKADIFFPKVTFVNIFGTLLYTIYTLPPIFIKSRWDFRSFDCGPRVLHMISRALLDRIGSEVWGAESAGQDAC